MLRCLCELDVRVVTGFCLTVLDGTRNPVSCQGRQNGRARVLASPTESSVAIPEDQEEGGSRCAVFALAAETERSERLLTPPPCKHADSFALLLVLSKPKHRFGFVRRNGGADVELSGLPGKRNGASPFGRYPLLHSSLPSRKSSLRLGDERRPYSAKAISSPASVAGGFQRGAHIPLWCALSFRLHPISFCTSRKKWGGLPNVRRAGHLIRRGAKRPGKPNGLPGLHLWLRYFCRMFRS